MHSLVAERGRKNSFFKLPSSVESLWTGCSQTINSCSQYVYNLGFIHSARKQVFSYAQFIHTMNTLVMNSFFSLITPINETYAQYPHSLLKLYIYIKENE